MIFGPSTYGGYIEKLSRKVEARLSDIEAIFNFDFGSEFEVAVCVLLEDILPAKFGICRGFAVTEDGQTAGDDLIIYDKLSCPLLRGNISRQYSIKEQIPVEAIYAYIECKHSISDLITLERAIMQTRNVKSLLLSRAAKINHEYEKDGPTYNGKIRDWPRTYPPLKNQPFCAIFARNFNSNIALPTDYQPYNPDLLVLGSNHIATHKAWLGADGIKGSLFSDEEWKTALFLESAKSNAFGLGIVSLLQALNWIELLPIDWADTLNRTFFKNLFE
ncbi:DUF6602 domain-containing protein [Methylophilus glucosoxydans]|uniref:DUF6602 domain-containing protein n=1 Tax=Methylophilus glucosoxydans TaxID=752553 RepID=A0ABW3GIL2_9PROT